jgi:nicotinamide phosphoribosyltransferase
MPLSMIRSNPILLCDAYNLSHQTLKLNTDFEISHMYNRKKGMILYGISEIVASVLSVQLTHEMVDEADKYANKFGFKFPVDLFRRVVDEFNGYAPLQIEAVKEGKYVPAGTPFAQIANTEEGFGELVSWWEGVFMQSYFASSCATEAFEMKRYLLEKQREGQYDDSFLWKIHSFGFRGGRSLEDAMWAGTAWNLFLNGTDDFHTAQHTPSAQLGSIRALAHKVTQQFNSLSESEALAAYGVEKAIPADVVAMFYAIDITAEEGSNIVALVIDTYNTYRVINEWVVNLARFAKTKGVKVVFRPDSGNVIAQAIDIYGLTQRENLDNVSVIIGEGMSFDVVKEYDIILESFAIPLDFVFYGMGGGFYNHINRDYLGWAMKTAYSNGANRMKFSEVEIKRSIPGAVGIYEQDGNLTVGYDVDPEKNQYNIIYYHDHQTGEPVINVQDWEETYKIAQAELNKVHQEFIVISDEIRAEVAKFEKELT